MARNEEAGRILRVLREDQFLTRAQFPGAMREKGIHERFIPCSKTLWRIEVLGAVPTERIKFGLARFYDRPVSTIWAVGETSARLAPLERSAA